MQCNFYLMRAQALLSTKELDELEDGNKVLLAAQFKDNPWIRQLVLWMKQIICQIDLG